MKNISNTILGNLVDQTNVRYNISQHQISSQNIWNDISTTDGSDTTWVNTDYTDPNYVHHNGYSNVTYTDYGMKLDENTIAFLEMVLIAMGVNITYKEFLGLSIDERKSLLRDIKIKQITK
jgi:hypothetical protein